MQRFHIEMYGFVIIREFRASRSYGGPTTVLITYQVPGNVIYMTEI